MIFHLRSMKALTEHKATNTTFTPSRSSVPDKYFNDIWELCIDVPEGHFEESDWEIDSRFTPLGPFVKCMNCESVGRWKMCSGTCRTTNKAAAFCSRECQMASWPEHKKTCKKI